jgi:hypothetical protein
MVDTGFATFSTTLDKTNRVLKEIEQAYGWPQERRKPVVCGFAGGVAHASRSPDVEEGADLRPSCRY